MSGRQTRSDSIPHLDAAEREKAPGDIARDTLVLHVPREFENANLGATNAATLRSSAQRQSNDLRTQLEVQRELSIALCQEAVRVAFDRGTYSRVQVIIDMVSDATISEAARISQQERSLKEVCSRVQIIGFLNNANPGKTNAGRLRLACTPEDFSQTAPSSGTFYFGYPNSLQVTVSASALQKLLKHSISGELDNGGSWDGQVMNLVFDAPTAPCLKVRPESGRKVA